MRYALSQFGIYEAEDENLRRLIGPPLEHAFRDYYGFDEVKSDRVVVYFRAMMHKEGIQLYVPYPGIAETLKELKDSGKRLAVVTSKIDHIARETLRRTGLIDYFEVISAQQPGVVVDKEVILAKP
ncbi:MAG TPA: HAD hydrolase-like protein [Candidatus Saccharimonadales bacterium]|nr:HAD hydrolase-like protein [Candidatus Saccharimonadales bacterium]